MPDLPTDIDFGYVVMTAVLAVGDTTGDVNLEPDATPATGSILFTPVAKQIISTATPPTMVLPQNVTCTFDNGVLVDPNGEEGVWLVVGQYDVSFSLTNAAITAFRIEVLATHTVLDPLDLTLASPIVPAPSQILVVNQQLYEDTVQARDEAEAFVAGTVGGTTGQSLIKASDDDFDYEWATGSVPAPATTTSQGIVKLAGDLGGTADLPTVPGLAGKAPLASPAFTGNPTAPTPATSDNDTSLATTAFVQAVVAALINAAPGALDTLDELAAAMGDDANFATTVTNALALKAPLASPTFTGDPKAPTPSPGDNDTSIATTAFVTDAISGFSGGGPSNQFYLWRNPDGIVSGNVRIGGNVVKDGNERWHFPDVGKIYFIPGYYEGTFGVDGFGVSLRGSDAGATVHMGIYTDNAGAPGTPVAAGSVGGSTSGWKNIDITAVTGLAEGWYWHAVLATGAGLDIHGGWMINPTDTSNMENAIRHNNWAGFRTVANTYTNLTVSNPAVETVNGVVPWMAVRFD